DLDRPLTTFSSLSSAGHRRPTFSFSRLPISLDRRGTGQIRFALNSARRNPRQSQPKNPMKIIISFLATVFLAAMTFAQEESASPAESTAPATEEKASATVEEPPGPKPAETATP